MLHLFYYLMEKDRLLTILGLRSLKIGNCTWPSDGKRHVCNTIRVHISKLGISLTIDGKRQTAKNVLFRSVGVGHLLDHLMESSRFLTRTLPLKISRVEIS